MNSYRGFSLTEVLVSLLLVTGTSMALLKQQWQTSQLFNQVHLRMQALELLDNVSERVVAGHAAIMADERFHLQQAYLNHNLNLQITWNSLSIQSNDCCMLQRQILVA